MNRVTKVFFIKDEQGNVWGMSPTIVQAKRQIAWFLPRRYKYIIESQLIFNE